MIFAVVSFPLPLLLCRLDMQVRAHRRCKSLTVGKATIPSSVDKQSRSRVNVVSAAFLQIFVQTHFWIGRRHALRVLIAMYLGSGLQEFPDHVSKVIGRCLLLPRKHEILKPPESIGILLGHADARFRRRSSPPVHW